MLRNILSPILGAEIVLYYLNGGTRHFVIGLICFGLLFLEPIFRLFKDGTVYI
jgi:hypothetical protein